MFFIFGWTSKVIGTKALNQNCPSCKLPALVLVGLQNFFHLFWLPVIPLSKSTQVVCGSCSASFPTESYRGNLSESDLTFKTPWWGLSFFYVVIPLIIVFVALGIYSSNESGERVSALKANPRAGVFLVWKGGPENAPYVFGKIVEVQDEFVVMRDSVYSFSKNYGKNGAPSAAESCQRNENSGCLQETPVRYSKQEFLDLPIDEIIPEL